MRKDLMSFDYNGNGVRVVLDENGNPWWVAKDVCAVLDIVDHHQAAQALDDDEVGRYEIPTIKGPRSATTINEPGLYTLIIRSNKPEANKFRRWITHEVLPSIRRTGRYEAPGSKPLSDAAARIVAMVGTRGLRPNQRIRLAELANRMSQLDPASQDQVLEIYGALCTAVVAPSGPDPVAHHHHGGEVAEFVDDRCVLDHRMSIVKGQLFSAYESHCRANSRQPLARHRFFMLLYSVCPSLRVFRGRLGTARCWMVTGIGLRLDAAQVI